MTPMLPLPSFFNSLTILREQQGLRTTLLGIGPMSERIVRVSLQVGKRRNVPLMFIASRNQVDIKELGGGYVRSWDQGSFMQTIKQLADEVQFSGLCYACRDHGGPWQRDAERENKLSPEEAMQIAKRSFLEDLLQGFDLLHIDPTKDPHAQSADDLGTVIDRTVELIGYVEKERRSRGLPEIGYEVGTEETSGGLTDADVYQTFIQKLNQILKDQDLPLPTFIVGQTGTLVRMAENVGNFDAGSAEALAHVAKKNATGLKEHNADYLADSILLQHPALGISAANVAPEFGVAETEAIIELGLAEAAAHDRGDLSSVSHIIDILSKKAVCAERWRKWLIGDDRQLAVEEVQKDDRMRMLIARICGHYVFDDPEVLECRGHLKRNLDVLGIESEAYIDDRVERSIDRYVICFGLEGLTDKVLAQ